MKRFHFDGDFLRDFFTGKIKQCEICQKHLRSNEVMGFDGGGRVYCQICVRRKFSDDYDKRQDEI